MMMPIQSNQHPWMKTWLTVMDHPYFAVTSEDGRYEIRNLPPGEYTVAAVTGSLNEQTVKIKAGPRGEATAGFIFTPGPSPRYNFGASPRGPCALVLPRPFAPP